MSDAFRECVAPWSDARGRKPDSSTRVPELGWRETRRSVRRNLPCRGGSPWACDGIGSTESRNSTKEKISNNQLFARRVRASARGNKMLVRTSTGFLSTVGTATTPQSEHARRAQLGARADLRW
jgi:hypothetical protein